MLGATHVDSGSALGGNYKMALELQVPLQSGNYQLDVIKRTHVDIGSAAWW